MVRKKSNNSNRNNKQVHINKYSLTVPFIVLWFLYYFCYIFAQQSPLFSRFNSIGSFIFGNSWLTIISWFAMLFGILGLYRESFIRKLFKQFSILSILTSLFINISLIDSNNIDRYLNYWWYISRIPIQFLKMIFGNNIFAMQIIIICSILWISVWIRYTISIDMPIINFVYKSQEPDNLKALDISKISKWQILTNNKNIWKTWFLSSIFGSKNTSNNANVDDKKNNFKTKSIWSEITHEENLRHARFEVGYDSKDDLKEKIKIDLLNRVWILKANQSDNSSNIKNNNIDKLNSLTPKIVVRFDFDAEKPTFDTKMLSHGDVKKNDLVDDIYIHSRANLIETKLAEFGINVKTVSYDIWPSIIQIQIKPQAGVKLSRIEWLKDDLLLALKTKTIRIIAPISGTDLVGIEIANPSPSMVHLADILESENYTSKMSDNMTNLPIGKAIDGSVLIKSFESMPHLLVAGATGMGKSVTVNGFILSLIYQNNPQELRFIMIDPKQVEMELYSGIPHLLAPIVTDSEKALKALKRCVDEMEMRYTILKNHRVKNIYEYNELVPKEEKMSRIVIVIDELADLMLSSKLRKDVEIAITRIAQKARAVGMHLLIATQRPQVNVITGIIKANIPARISLWVISWIDSRTILDTKWAEDLMSKWDLLYIDPANRQPIRVQSPFISTGDTEKIIKMIKTKYLKWITDENSIYDQDLLAILNSNKWEWWSGSLFDSGSGGGSDDDDWLISNAMELISGMRTASTTMLQRKLQIWFSRAWRIMDELERRGIVWPQESGGKPRQVLM